MVESANNVLDIIDANIIGLNKKIKINRVNASNRNKPQNQLIAINKVNHSYQPIADQREKHINYPYGMMRSSRSRMGSFEVNQSIGSKNQSNIITSPTNLSFLSQEVESNNLQSLRLKPEQSNTMIGDLKKSSTARLPPRHQSQMKAPRLISNPLTQ